MSRLLVRSAISNFSRLANSGASASLKSKGILRVACQGFLRLDYQLMSSTNKSCSSNMSSKEFVQCLEESIHEEETLLKPVGFTIGNFEITNINDAKVELKGKYFDKEIKVKFNVNDQIIEKCEVDQKPQFCYDLKFAVEFNKATEKSLIFKCRYFNYFSESQIFDPKFIILKNENWGKHKDEYEELLKEVGIDKRFVRKLRMWIINYHMTNYVKLLGGLKDFASA